MTIEVFYDNGNFDHIDMRFCCPSLSWCKTIGLKEDGDSRNRRFYMAIKKSEIIQHIDKYHVTMKHEYSPISFCPFCGEEIVIENKEVVKE